MCPKDVGAKKKKKTWNLSDKTWQPLLIITLLNVFSLADKLLYFCTSSTELSADCTVSIAAMWQRVLSLFFDQVVHEIRNYPYPQLHLLALQSLNPSRHATAVRESYEVSDCPMNTLHAPSCRPCITVKPCSRAAPLSVYFSVFGSSGASWQNNVSSVASLSGCRGLNCLHSRTNCRCFFIAWEFQIPFHLTHKTGIC